MLDPTAVAASWSRRPLLPLLPGFHSIRSGWKSLEHIDLYRLYLTWRWIHRSPISICLYNPIWSYNPIINPKCPIIVEMCHVEIPKDPKAQRLKAFTSSRETCATPLPFLANADNVNTSWNLEKKEKMINKPLAFAEISVGPKLPVPITQQDTRLDRTMPVLASTCPNMLRRKSGRVSLSWPKVTHQQSLVQPLWAQQQVPISATSQPAGW